MPDNTTDAIERVSVTLKKAADQLESYSAFPFLSPTQKRQLLWYAPFMRELGSWPQFCQTLARIELPENIDDLPVEEGCDLMFPLVSSFQLPKLGEYSRATWVSLLFQVLYSATKHANFLPPMALISNPFLGQTHLEVQFIYFGTIGQAREYPEKFPMVRAVVVKVPDNFAKTQVKDILKAQLKPPLHEFLKSVRPLGSRFTVRLITRSVDTPESVVLRRETRFQKGNRTSSILNGVANNLVSALEEIVDFTPGQGRLPDTSSAAHWWALAEFKGLTVPEIAKRVSNDDPNAADFEDRISKALKRLG